MDPPYLTADTGTGNSVNVAENYVILHENESGSNDNYERKVLPSELSRSHVVKLTCESVADGGVCDVYLVGTVHVSKVSCKEVQAVIEYLKPQVVFLELCSRRIDVCKPNQNFKAPTFRQMVEMWKQNRSLCAILRIWLQAEMASKLGVVPGAEFLVAYEEAKKYGGKVILGDRPYEITSQRTSAKMPLRHKAKLFFFLLFQVVLLRCPQHLSNMLARFVPLASANPEQIDDADLPTIEYRISEMSKHFPTLTETLVHERDQYVSAMLLSIARKHNSVVAVVGKGHLSGIKKNWKKPVEVKKLLSLPSKKDTVPMSKILGTIEATVAGVAVIAGLISFCRNRKLCASP